MTNAVTQFQLDSLQVQVNSAQAEIAQLKRDLEHAVTLLETMVNLPPRPTTEEEFRKVLKHLLANYAAHLYEQRESLTDLTVTVTGLDAPLTYNVVINA